MSLPPPPGIYVPAVLFMTEDEEIDFSSTKSHILRLAQGGITGLVVQGSNGEAQFLSHEERKLAIKFTRKVLDENGFQNVVIIAGTGAQSTKETKQLCVDARDAGASHALVITPSTWPPQMTRENIIRFHREIADASPIPTLIYNIPVVTAGLDLDSDVILTLAEHPNIVGAKLTCANIGKLHRIASTHPRERFAVFAGKSDILLQSLLSGSAGVIGGLVNIAPRTHVRLYELWEKNELQEAMQLQSIIGHADWAMQKLGPIGGVKGVVWRNFGYGQGFVRSPLAPLSDERVNLMDTSKVAQLIKLETTNN